MKDLSELKGIGPGRLRALHAAGILSLRDLLYFFPVRYEDHSTVYPLDFSNGGKYLFYGRIGKNPVTSYHQKRSRTTTFLEDGKGNTLHVVWFNEPWIKNLVRAGGTIRLYGRLIIADHRRELMNPSIVSDFGLVPVYRKVPSVSNGILRKLIQEALASRSEELCDQLPLSFRNEHHLTDLDSALYNIHFPQDEHFLEEAKKRISFEQLLYYNIYITYRAGLKRPAPAITIHDDQPDEFWNSLPFIPTASQMDAVQEISSDLKSGYAMRRIIQGDVGCGKTIIAFASAFIVQRAGFQSCLMAPTEILAQQHYDSALRILSPLGIRVRLLTGSTGSDERKKILNEIHTSLCDFLIGTHSLLNREVSFCNLGIVITDEQHRFGVDQRLTLQNKDSAMHSLSPHVLIMSATPIPRTMAMILYGDLQLSVIREMPEGRLPVSTRIIPESKRNDMYRFVRQQAQNGCQTYIVCPFLEESDSSETRKSVKALYRTLSEKELNGLRIDCIWGSQNPYEKKKVMDAFLRGETDILISTSVIEVGVNNPNATVMIIESAERFGLSQIHQLRGRVGRGQKKSWCFLMTEQTERMRFLCGSNDGFAVSQKDLELRGPGELIGTRQSGEMDNHELKEHMDYILIREIVEIVKKLRNNMDDSDTWKTLLGNALRFYEEEESDVGHSSINSSNT